MRSLTMQWQECGLRRTATPLYGETRSTMGEMVGSAFSMVEEVTIQSSLSPAEMQPLFKKKKISRIKYE